MTTVPMVPPGSSTERLSTLHLSTPADNGGSFLLPEQSGSIWLPPKDAWLINPFKEKIDTPLNHHGIVDQRQLLANIDATLDPTYIWPHQSINPHHFQWAEEKYSRQPMPLTGVIPAHFRDLAPLKARLPRVLENWIHLVTIEPPVPSEEVMFYTVEAWEVAKGLFDCDSNERVWSRRAGRRKTLLRAKPEIVGAEPPESEEQEVKDPWGRAFFTTIETQTQRARGRYLKRLELIPHEFRLVQSNTGPRKISKSIGVTALRGARKLTREANRLPLAA